MEVSGRRKNVKETEYETAPSDGFVDFITSYDDIKMNSLICEFIKKHGKIIFDNQALEGGEADGNK